jgi:hypothetical protein
MSRHSSVFHFRNPGSQLSPYYMRGQQTVEDDKLSHSRPSPHHTTPFWGILSCELAPPAAQFTLAGRYIAKVEPRLTNRSAQRLDLSGVPTLSCGASRSVLSRFSTGGVPRSAMVSNPMGAIREEEVVVIGLSPQTGARNTEREGGV